MTLPGRKFGGLVVLMAMIWAGTAFAFQTETGPPLPQELLEQGNEFSRRGMWKEAIAAYEKALEQRPGYLEAHYNLASAYVANQQPEGAIR